MENSTRKMKNKRSKIIANFYICEFVSIFGSICLGIGIGIFLAVNNEIIENFAAVASMMTLFWLLIAVVAGFHFVKGYKNLKIKLKYFEGLNEATYCENLEYKNSTYCDGLTAKEATNDSEIAVLSNEQVSDVAVKKVGRVQSAKACKCNLTKGQIAGIVMASLSFICFALVLIFSLVARTFQPLALSTEAAVFMIIGLLFLVASAYFSVFCDKRGAYKIVVPILLIAVMFTGIIWAGVQGWQDFGNIREKEKFIFQNGEGGYFTFRIPSLVALDKDVIDEKYGITLNHDMLLATAEGRRNSSRDTGDIDMVYKYSLNNGASWSNLAVLFEVEGEVGKVGNPTPVFDKVNGILNIAYLRATKASGYDYYTYNVQGKLNKDFTFTFGNPTFIGDRVEGEPLGGGDGVNNNTYMVGPGKAIQIENGEHAGRLIIPCSNRGNAFVEYSDDFGLTWKRGGNAGTGNECEATELANGELMMVIRENKGCSTLHCKQYQRLAFSRDCGETWYITATNTTLKTPICMASVVTDHSGLVYLSYPDSFFTRTKLTVARSIDNGKNWETKLIYSGVSGYSCMTVNSSGEIFMLAEVGKVNYN
ncbi:MAG: sialidase family protein, partial [Clostridia bacterium]